jgi:chromosome segregation ATPase
MTMIEPMNELTDEVLKSVQRRLSALEAEVADIRSELRGLRNDLEAARANQPEINLPPAGIESRVARIERRLDSVDAAVK